MLDTIETPRPTEQIRRPTIEVASTVRANPDHPLYTADRAVAKTLCGGRSAIIAALDGVGAGGPDSAKAAETVQRNLLEIQQRVAGKTPTLNEGTELLRETIFKSTEEIKEMQKKNPEIDTTVSAAIICESPDGKKRFLLTANVGDSRIYCYKPRTGKVEQLTTDHSLVQWLVNAGEIKESEAFNHPDRNVITRAVGSLEKPEEIDLKVCEVKKGDIYLAVSDGVSDNLTPEGLPVAIRDEFQNCYDRAQRKPNLKKMADGIARRAGNVMTGTRAEHAKPDDICVAILRVY